MANPPEKKISGRCIDQRPEISHSGRILSIARSQFNDGAS
jgi:hypothetical protein